MKHYDLVIIGGGMAGSYLAQHFKDQDFCLFEASYKLGGRHWTVSKNEHVLYEAGAWRLHSSHKRMLKLLKKYQLNVREFEDQKASQEEIVGTKGLTKLDDLILKYDGNIKKALIDELKTGYQGAYENESSTHPYRTKTKEGKYYVIEEGQEEIIKRLTQGLDKERIKLHHRVMDIEKKRNKYLLTVLEGSDDKITKHFFTATKVISCIAQFDAWAWQIVQAYLYPLMNAVFPHPLHHIYAKGKIDLKGKRKNSNSVIQQEIKPTHDKEWFQVSYTAGRAAEFWNRYKLKFGDRKLKSLLEKYTDSKLDEIKSYHWTNGYHMWRAVPDFDLKKAVNYSIEPNPVILPNFYWAGECFSSFQGWSEGALETADLVIKVMEEKTHLVPIYKRVPKDFTEWMVFDHRILNVKSWKYVHPGSKELIEKHIKEDISEWFRYIKHSEISWAELYALQIGYRLK